MFNALCSQQPTATNAASQAATRTSKLSEQVIILDLVLYFDLIFREILFFNFRFISIISPQMCES